MKAIMMSIRPQWVAPILNGEKLWEIRKRFPKDYVGWVYIYCTKDSKGYLTEYLDKKTNKHLFYSYELGKNIGLNGKVVARFWCDKVEVIKLPYTKFGTDEWVGCENDRTLQTETMNEPELLKKSCISEDEIYEYLNFKHSPHNCGYAIHITNLEIFDKPKKISEFRYYKKFSEIDYMLPIPRKETCERLVALTKAPQSFMYVEAQN